MSQATDLPNMLLKGMCNGVANLTGIHVVRRINQSGFQRASGSEAPLHCAITTEGSPMIKPDFFEVAAPVLFRHECYGMRLYRASQSHGFIEVFFPFCSVEPCLPAECRRMVV